MIYTSNIDVQLDEDFLKKVGLEEIKEYVQPGKYAIVKKDVTFLNNKAINTVKIIGGEYNDKEIAENLRDAVDVFFKTIETEGYVEFLRESYSKADKKEKEKIKELYEFSRDFYEYLNPEELAFNKEESIGYAESPIAYYVGLLAKLALEYKDKLEGEKAKDFAEKTLEAFSDDNTYAVVATTLYGLADEETSFLGAYLPIGELLAVADFIEKIQFLDFKEYTEKSLSRKMMLRDIQKENYIDKLPKRMYRTLVHEAIHASGDKARDENPVKALISLDRYDFVELFTDLLAIYATKTFPEKEKIDKKGVMQILKEGKNRITGIPYRLSKVIYYKNMDKEGENRIIDGLNYLGSLEDITTQDLHDFLIEYANFSVEEADLATRLYDQYLETIYSTDILL